MKSDQVYAVTTTVLNGQHNAPNVHIIGERVPMVHMTTQSVPAAAAAVESKPILEP